MVCHFNADILCMNSDWLGRPTSDFRFWDQPVTTFALIIRIGGDGQRFGMIRRSY